MEDSQPSSRFYNKVVRWAQVHGWNCKIENEYDIFIASYEKDRMKMKVAFVSDDGTILLKLYDKKLVINLLFAIICEPYSFELLELLFKEMESPRPRNLPALLSSISEKFNKTYYISAGNSRLVDKAFLECISYYE